MAWVADSIGDLQDVFMLCLSNVQIDHYEDVLSNDNEAEDWQSIGRGFEWLESVLPTKNFKKRKPLWRARVRYHRATVTSNRSEHGTSSQAHLEPNDRAVCNKGHGQELYRSVPRR